MSSIEIKKTDITKLDTDAIVNAANEELWEGGGVCGAIFYAAGSAELTKACNASGDARRVRQGHVDHTERYVCVLLI